MKWTRYALAVLVALTLAGLSFYAYGALRTMQENVGLSARPVVVSAACPLVLLAISVATVLAARSFASDRLAISKRMIALLAGCWLLGCATSEVWILADERSFAHELSLRPPTELYSRARNWPNQDCSLVYIPQQGIRATD